MYNYTKSEVHSSDNKATVTKVVQEKKSVDEWFITSDNTFFVTEEEAFRRQRAINFYDSSVHIQKFFPIPSELPEVLHGLWKELVQRYHDNSWPDWYEEGKWTVNDSHYTDVPLWKAIMVEDSQHEVYSADYFEPVVPFICPEEVDQEIDILKDDATVS